MSGIDPHDGPDGFDDPWLAASLQRLAGDAPAPPDTTAARGRIARRATRLRLVRHAQLAAVAGLSVVAAAGTALAVRPDGARRVETTAAVEAQREPRGAAAHDGAPGSTVAIAPPASPSTRVTVPATTGPEAPPSSAGPAPTIGGEHPSGGIDPGGGNGPADGGAAPDPSSEPTPAPAPSAPAPDEPAPVTTAPPASGTKTYTVRGGTVVIRWTASALTLVSATPNPGYRESHEAQPTELEVVFQSSNDESTVHVHLTDGVPVEAGED